MNPLDHAGIALLSPSLRPRWQVDGPAVLRTLRSHCRHAARYAALAGLDAARLAGSLRDDLRCVAPGLAAFAAHLGASADAEGEAALAPELGLAGFDDGCRTCLLLALGACLDDPASGEPVADGSARWILVYATLPLAGGGPADPTVWRERLVLVEAGCGEHELLDPAQPRGRDALERTLASARGRSRAGLPRDSLLLVAPRHGARAAG